MDEVLTVYVMMFRNVLTLGGCDAAAGIFVFDARGGNGFYVWLGDISSGASGWDLGMRQSDGTLGDSC